MRTAGVWLTILCILGTIDLRAEDWPEFRGRGRIGVWTESGIVEKLPAGGLKVRWRTPIRSAFSGPAVAGGRVFITDYQTIKRPAVKERVLALDEKTGRVLWTHEWDANYTGLQDTWWGPRATPTVDGDRVYVLGGTGILHALNVETGRVLWSKDYVKDFGIEVPPWGVTGAPLVDGNRLICVVGGTTLDTWQPPPAETETTASGQVPVGKVMAFDKMTGKELWRTLPANSEAGYSQPIIIEAGGTRQLIVWHPGALASLDPQTGKVYWEQRFRIRHGATVATPVFDGRHLLVSSYWNGSMMVALDPKKPAATLLWQGKEDSDILTDTLHALINTPTIYRDHVYGVCSFGQLRSLKVSSGERVWESLEVTKERRRHTTAFIVRHGDRFFINNDRGDLMIGYLTPEGYFENSRVPLIKPTSDSAGTRRELKVVNWSHPAYANRHIFARNDEEIISASLAADEYK